jgi:plastocyanin
MIRAMSVRTALLATLALASGGLLAACGEDEPQRIEGRELRVELDEFRIIPEDVSVAPGRLRIVAVNIGRLTHNLHVVKEDEEDREAPPTDLGGTGTAQPGETATFTFDDLRPGEYRIVCTITNHDDLGQYGELIVREEGE